MIKEQFAIKANETTTLIIQRQNFCKHNDVIVAFVNSENVIARYIEKDGEKILIPEYNGHAPIVLASGMLFNILGKVIEKRTKIS